MITISPPSKVPGVSMQCVVPILTLRSARSSSSAFSSPLRLASPNLPITVRRDPTIAGSCMNTESGKSSKGLSSITRSPDSLRVETYCLCCSFARSKSILVLAGFAETHLTYELAGGRTSTVSNSLSVSLNPAGDGSRIASLNPIRVHSRTWMFFLAQISLRILGQTVTLISPR